MGTSALTRIRGGAFGYGLSENLMLGYDWLARRYIPNDEIWILGFSRGAYTARSLIGLIRKCGLLHISSPVLLKSTEELYRDSAIHPDDRQCKEFRARNSREVRIQFLGVWDTVGALGIPGTMLSERGKFSWHDTRLSKIVDHAYQTMALDEYRAAYDCVLWTREGGADENPGQKVEQRWFIGAHANVGGGYEGDDPLADLALAWMQDRASAAGLKLDRIATPADYLRVRSTDSYGEFMNGVYRMFRRVVHGDQARHVRNYNRSPKGWPAVGVSVDPSVWSRWQADPHYRPPTLSGAGLSPP